MPREPYRPVNPGRSTDEYAARQLGFRSQFELEELIERVKKYQDDASRRAVVIPARVMSFYTEATATSIVMRRAPKTTVVMTTAIRYPLGMAGRIIGGSLWSSSAWSAGTAQLQVRISKGGGTETLYTLPEPLVIDGATGADGHIRTQSAEWICPFINGIRFAAGEAIRVQLLLSGWTVSTPDWGAELILAYEQGQ